ncbi:MAG TPA: hypothetical protein VHF88_06675 [Thermoleophilaceae bacterium]|nr:hypothetical protein [Thermoleophilaceae bacterium]
MIDVLERQTAPAQPLRPTGAVDERPARRALQAQIERLEADLASLFVASWPRKGLEFGVDLEGGRPRIRDLGELEQIRDALAERVADARRDLRARHAAEDANRHLIGDMLECPERHRWVRVSNADIGEPGCHHWHVVPRWGPVGMFANWWRVKISSGCPLAT